MPTPSVDDTAEDETSVPKLIEPNTYTYLSNVLAKCNETRASVYLYALNISVFVIFVIVVSAILYFRYTSKPTAEQLKQKELADHAYILSKIRHYKRERDHMATRTNLSGLPILDNRPL